MSIPGANAKYVAALDVAVVGAATFVGVSHDGRGASGAVDTVPDPVVTSTAPASVATLASAPEPTVPEASPRLRVRSHGS